jgi:putative hemolysin
LLIHVHLVVIPFLLLLAALFAAAEASLFSLSRTQLESIRESRPLTYARIRSLIFRPDALLSTIIIGNECLNILIGTFVVALLESNFPKTDDTFIALSSVLLSSILLLAFSEVLPKVLAFRSPLMMASVLVYPASWAQFILTPFRKIFLAISGEILKIFGVRAKPPAALSEKDFLTLVEVGAESGSLDRDEKEMIFNVFHFGDLSVSTIMTPWKDVFCITEKTSVDDILKKVRKKTYSRIPVVSAKENRVLGILYTKELFKLLISPNANGAEILKRAIFPPYIVSTHKKVSKLFREFKLKKVHMALVVDEYGKQLGVVTLDDLLNSIFRTQKKVGGA